MPPSKPSNPEVKPRNSAQTKNNILRAAQQAFTEHGYTGTGMRDIADAAGINVALVTRYFGSKEKLFEAALADCLAVDRLLDCPRDAFGKHVLSIMIGEDGVNPIAMMVMSTADASAREITMRLEQELVIKPLAKWLGPPHAEARAAHITLLCSGFSTYRNLLPLPSLTSVLRPVSRRWLESTLQAIVDGSA